ncbi:MAG: AtpZ/AtpI family protein [Bacteroidales bacterium]|jgi:F0F1-type ATP synthase assembly protein I|nr:AtpZ/AtpI family protein [Bacteroidales bacterium]
MSNSKNNKPANLLNKFAKYSSLAIEMGVIIGGCALLGNYIDKKFAFAKPYSTMILSLVGVISSLLLIINQLKNDKK